MPIEIFEKQPRKENAIADIASAFKECPSEFQQESNPWHEFAVKWVNGRGVRGDDWKFKKVPVAEKVRKLSWLTLVITVAAQDPRIDEVFRHKCCSVAAWMLSEMLEAVPPYVPLYKD